MLKGETIAVTYYGKGEEQQNNHAESGLAPWCPMQQRPMQIYSVTHTADERLQWLKSPINLPGCTWRGVQPKWDSNPAREGQGERQLGETKRNLLG